MGQEVYYGPFIFFVYFFSLVKNQHSFFFCFLFWRHFRSDVAAQVLILIYEWINFDPMFVAKCVVHNYRVIVFFFIYFGCLHYYCRKRIWMYRENFVAISVLRTYGYLHFTSETKYSLRPMWFKLNNNIVFGIINVKPKKLQLRRLIEINRENNVQHEDHISALHLYNSRLNCVSKTLVCLWTKKINLKWPFLLHWICLFCFFKFHVFWVN